MTALVRHAEPDGNFGYMHDDGGRKAAGYRGTTGDCVLRALAIGTSGDYAQIRKDLMRIAKELQVPGGVSVFNGTNALIPHHYLTARGWVAVDDRDAYLRPADLPACPLIVHLSSSHHYVAVVDGVVRDTWDSRFSRKTDSGLSKVKRYYYRPTSADGLIGATDAVLIQECQAFAAASRNVVVRAVALGQKLMAKKAAVGHGGWERWVRKTLPIGPRMVRHLMALAEHADIVLADPKLLTVADAIRLIRKTRNPAPQAAKSTLSQKRVRAAVQTVMTAVQSGSLSAEQRKAILAALKS